jgi:Na+-driven multidrug efflux pump
MNWNKIQIRILWINFLIMIVIGFMTWINGNDLASIFASIAAIISQYHIYNLRKFAKKQDGEEK